MSTHVTAAPRTVGAALAKRIGRPTPGMVVVNVILLIFVALTIIPYL